MDGGLVSWILAHPLATVLTATAIPIAITLVSAWRSRGDEATPAAQQAEGLDVGAQPVPTPPASLRDRLRLTSDHMVGRLARLVGDRTVDQELLDELEAVLLGADLGVRTSESLLATVRRESAGRDAAAVRDILREAIREKLERVDPAPVAPTGGRPHVIIVLGVNGSGLHPGPG